MSIIIRDYIGYFRRIDMSISSLTVSVTPTLKAGCPIDIGLWWSHIVYVWEDVLYPKLMHL